MQSVSERLPVLLAALGLSAAMLFGHLLALEHFLYWRHWWYDMLMHAIGGAALAALTLGTIGRTPALFWGMMVIMLIGWEIFEYIGGISTGQPNFLLDTGIDIAIGATTAAIAFISIRSRITHG